MKKGKLRLIIALQIVMFVLIWDRDVKAATPLGTFSISSLSANEIIFSDKKIIWSTSSGASYYTISIKNLDDGTYVTELEKVYTTVYNMDYDDLEPGAHYTIGIVAYASDGVTTKYGGNVNFVAAPSKFSISNPSEDEIIFSDKIIKWNASSGAEYYTLSIKNLDDGTYVTELEKVYATSYSMDYSDLEPGAHYTIGIVAYNSDGSGSRYGGNLDFVVAPEKFSIISPKNGAQIAEDFTVNWSASSGADYYTLSIKNMDNSTYVTELEKVYTTSYSVNYDDLMPGTVYRIGVVAYNSDGSGFRNGGTVSFETKEESDAIQGKYVSYNGDSYLLMSDKKRANTISRSLVSTKAAALDILTNNIHTLIKNYDFNAQQIACLQNIVDTIDNSNVTLEEMKSTIEFRFEGAGAYYGNVETPADSCNSAMNKNKLPSGYDIKGLFGAMTVVIQDGDVAGVFFRTSTLPDDYYHYNTGVIADGWYDLVSWNHGNDDQVFAALQLRTANNSQSIPAIYDNVGNKTASEGINIHHNYGSSSVRYSEGCLTVFLEDWDAYIKLYGYNNNSTYGYLWGHNTNGIKTINKNIGKIYVERCIDIVIDVGSKKYSQYADCEHIFKKSDMSKVEYIFSDVINGAWYVPSVQYVYDNVIMQGKSKIVFAPTAKITREEFAQILYNMKGKPSVQYKKVFSDVSNKQWFAKAVTWAYERRIVNGYSNGKYGVGDPITREQMAVMLYKYARSFGYDMTTDMSVIRKYSDRGQVSSWAEKAMAWAVSQKVITGKKQLDGSMRLDPAGKSSRAECATMITNLLTKNAF